MTSSLGFKQSLHDHALFVLHNSSTFIIASVYVDDALLTGSSLSEISRVKQALDAQFTIKDIGHAFYFLGMELCHPPTGIFINQRKYILDLLSFPSFSLSNSCSYTPLRTTYKSLFLPQSPYSNPSLYRQLIVKLLYLSLTRLDISFATHFLSQFVSSPSQSHFDALHHLLGYLKGTIAFGLFYPVQSSFKLKGFADADWTSCLHTRKSTSGYCIFL